LEHRILDLSAIEHDDVVHSIHRQRLQSKVVAEKMVISFQNLLSLVFELEVAYALYDIPSVASQREELVKDLNAEAEANLNKIESLKFKVGNCLDRIQAHRSQLQHNTRI
jgi:hypothetical protein